MIFNDFGRFVKIKKTPMRENDDFISILIGGFIILGLILTLVFLIEKGGPSPVWEEETKEEMVILKPTDEETLKSFVQNFCPANADDISSEPNGPPERPEGIDQVPIGEVEVEMEGDEVREEKIVIRSGGYQRCIEKNHPQVPIQDVLVKGDFTPVVVNIDGIEITVCVVGREIIRQYYNLGGPLYSHTLEMAKTLATLKKKIPDIRNQPEWFTIMYILDPLYSPILDLECENAKGFYAFGVGRSIFYYCYGFWVTGNKKAGLELEKNCMSPHPTLKRNPINEAVVHEAVHALDARLARKYAGHLSDVSFISKVSTLPFNRFLTRLSEDQLFTIGDYLKNQFCPDRKFALVYFSSREVIRNVKQREKYEEFFADLTVPFLACESSYKIPRPRTEIGSKLREFKYYLERYGIIEQ